MRPSVYTETIELIVEEYELGNAGRASEVIWWRADGKNFDAVIDRAARAEISGKRHPHQRRLKAQAIKDGVAALLAIKDRLQAAPDFLELWFLVQAAFKPIAGLGELAIYDTADRLRHRLNLVSEHVIFLHAGARVGARRLAGGRLAKESAWGILRLEVPMGLRHLSTHEIEDILCIYKDELLLSPQQFLARRSGVGSPGCSPVVEARPSC
ncbi:hypothetical protein [Brevundimonas sp.]|uniref:hypothetical protein n=1 Tax=Brevundimonas sp. TaxID=1871086 RepID=UPI002FCC02FB